MELQATIYDFKITGHLKLKSSEYDSCVVLFLTDQIRSRHNIPHVSDYCGVQLICAVFTIKTTIELLTVLQIGNYWVITVLYGDFLLTYTVHLD